MRIGILGGSFDPIHHGHLIAAVSLMEVLGLHEVRLVIAGQQPFKGVERGHHATAEHRARMVELAVAGGHEGLMADRRELDRAGPSYTVETLRELRDEHPDAELLLLVGSDAAAAMEAWRDPEGIRELARVVVFRRGQTASESRPGPAEFAVPRVDISSTEIRHRVALGRSIRYWLPDAVLEYIARHRLYQEGL